MQVSPLVYAESRGQVRSSGTAHSIGMSKLEVTVTTDTQHTDTAFPTASWYDRYTIKAGTYELVPFRFAGSLWYRLTVNAVLTESYRVNRLFSASKAVSTEPNRETTLGLTYRGYTVTPGGTVRVGALDAVVTEVETES